MNVELKAIWSGDINGPSRGLLADADTVFPTRAAPPIQAHCGPMIGRSRPRRVKPSTFETLSDALRQHAQSSWQLQQRCGVSKCVVDNVLHQLRLDGMLRSRLIRRTFAGPRKVYWIQEDGKTRTDEKKVYARVDSQ